jgi:hypothetical protein
MCSAPTPVDGVPVADHDEHEKEKRDHEQASGFGGVDRMSAMFKAGVVLARCRNHANIVRPSEQRSRANLYRDKCREAWTNNLNFHLY